jgi:hypothetical protein
MYSQNTALNTGTKLLSSENAEGNIFLQNVALYQRTQCHIPYDSNLHEMLLKHTRSITGFKKLMQQCAIITYPISCKHCNSRSVRDGSVVGTKCFIANCRAPCLLFGLIFFSVPRNTVLNVPSPTFRCTWNCSASIGNFINR